LGTLGGEDPRAFVSGEEFARGNNYHQISFRNRNTFELDRRSRRDVDPWSFSRTGFACLINVSINRYQYAMCGVRFEQACRGYGPNFQVISRIHEITSLLSKVHVKFSRLLPEPSVSTYEKNIVMSYPPGAGLQAFSTWLQFGLEPLSSNVNPKIRYAKLGFDLIICIYPRKRFNISGCMPQLSPRSPGRSVPLK